jgi:4-diphosphocytidyl-2-C-methyl-D-erythritol kinase
MPRSLILRPSAKINLTLRVGPRRADGFHDVQTLLQSIAVSDTLTFTARRGPFALATRAPGVPADQTNLIWTAAAAFWRALGREGDPRDVHVKLEKQIPAAAGLGGGSANAAAALVGLNQIWDVRRPRRELLRIAATLGSDVPFFLQCGTAMGTGRGETLYPVDDLARQGVVVIKPSFGIATADAYKWLDEDRLRIGESSDRQIGQSVDPEARPPVLEGGWPGLPLTLFNDLQPPVARRHAEIGEMIAACLREGAVAAAMTGSGSAVFGLFSEAAAKKAVRRLQRPGWLVLLTRTLSRQEASRRAGL